MIEVWMYSLLSVLGISVISLVGIVLFSLRANKLKRFLLYLVSFSAGALFGDVFLHLLPEAVEDAGFTLQISLYVLGGVVFSFIVEKIIHWRHCHAVDGGHAHPFAVMNLYGDAVHNFIDGILIAGSYLVSIPVGIATTLAVLFHEIPQEIGDYGVLLHGGFSRGKALLFNFLIALTAVGGVILTLLLNSFFGGLAAILVPFAAGTFLYIAGSDLIPELHKDIGVRKALLQLIAFVAGMAVMGALLFLE